MLKLQLQSDLIQSLHNKKLHNNKQELNKSNSTAKDKTHQINNSSNLYI